jgi:hypothetical protein
MSKSFKLNTMEGNSMIRTFSLLYFFFFFASSIKTSHSSEEVPPLALSWEADVYLANFNSQQEEKIKHAVAIIKKVIALKEFRDRILNFTYKGVNNFFDNEGMTNTEVYQKLLEGAERIGNTSKNNTLNVELELYHQSTNTIGYTYPNTARIWMNTKYFNKYTPVKVADNLMHEWMHKIGFTHAVRWSKDRDHSVPYAVGYLIEELAEKLPH